MSVLVQNSVRSTLLNMAIPMLAGTFSMSAYNLTDAWFVSRLGTLPLAAMGFTFPVAMLLTFVAGGIGSGVTTLASHAIGRHDHPGAARITTHGLLLTLGVAVAMAIGGFLSIEPVFAKLGANAETLPLVRQFMRIWYLGAVFMALPMMGNGILISMGDSRTASRFMLLGTALNAILNPFLIFGWLGLPALGIRGSALATVIAQAVSTVWLFLLLYRKHRLLLFSGWKFDDWFASCKKILGFAIPSILSMILMPISAAVITRLLAGFGNEAVAASGAAARIETLAFVIPMALGMSLTPFVSQNFGANRLDRICEARILSMRFAFLYGAGGFFSEDARVVSVLAEYIRIISFGYGMMEVHRYCGFFLTGLHRPVSATMLDAIRVLVLLIPLSCLGARFFGVRGVFIGRLITDLVVGCIGFAWVRRLTLQPCEIQ